MVANSDFSGQYWIGFVIFFTALSLINHFFICKDSNEIKRNIFSTVFWFISANILMVIIGFLQEEVGKDHSLDFFAGYIIELTLSVDNVFVFIIIFERLKITGDRQHLILRIGIISAIIMRLIMILFAIELIQQFTWVFYIFGGILIFSAIHMLFKRDVEDKEPGYKKYFVESKENKFFKRHKGKLVPTINLLALILVEKTDLLFAVDSIPAVITVTRDTFIIFASNVMAIAGLRALFFCLSHSANSFYYLKHGIVVILLFIGIKLILLPQEIHIPKELSISFIFIVVAAAVIASKVRNSKLSLS
jgi:tellurite resistance protein TerC